MVSFINILKIIFHLDQIIQILFFPSGLKFNKLDAVYNLEDENIECNLQSAAFLNQNDYQEIKTRINHFAPNCKSYQRVKNVLDVESRGVYQGKYM